MISAISQVNWVGVLAASVANFVLGGAWFMGLFRRHYAAALGIAHRPQERPGALFIVGPFVCGGLTIATTAIVLKALAIRSLSDALVLGALVGLGFLAPMTVNIAINPLFPRPFRYALINAPYFVLGSLVSSAILVALG